MVKKYSSPTQLGWIKSKSGYQFVLLDSKRYIVENPAENRSDDGFIIDCTCDPLKDFVNISPQSPATILSYAEKYGLLTMKQNFSSLYQSILIRYNNNPAARKRISDMIKKDPTDAYQLSIASDHVSPSNGPLNLAIINALSVSNIEPLELWSSEHKKISTVLYIWDLISRNNHSALQKMISWQQDDYFTYAFPSPEDKRNRPFSVFRKTIRVPNLNNDKPTLTPRYLFHRGDFRSAALYALRDEVDAMLSEHPFAPKLYYCDLRQPVLVRRTVSRSLLGLLWFEVSQLVTGQRHLRQCKNCHKWEEISDHHRIWSEHRDCKKYAAKKTVRSKVDEEILQIYAEHHKDISETVARYNSLHPLKPITARKVEYALKKMAADFSGA